MVVTGGRGVTAGPCRARRVRRRRRPGRPHRPGRTRRGAAPGGRGRRRQHRPGAPGRSGRHAGRLALRPGRPRRALAPVGRARTSCSATRTPPAAAPAPGTARRRDTRASRRCHRAGSRRRSGSSPARAATGGDPHRGRLVRILIWHVHGSWTTSFVAGTHDYVLPLLPDRGRDGLGRARTWQWPGDGPGGAGRASWPTSRSTSWCCNARTRRPWSSGSPAGGPGVTCPRSTSSTTPRPGTPSARVHPVVTEEALRGIPVVHVTYFNAMAWDCGDSADHRHRARRGGPRLLLVR